MLKNLFKPKWQSSKPDVRRDALRSLDIGDPEQQRIVVALASNDPVEEVRLAACLCLRKPGDVFAALASEISLANREKMLAHLGECFNTSGTLPPEHQRVGWLDALSGAELATLIRHTREASWCELLLQNLRDGEQLLDIALHGATAQWRQQAAQRLSAEADLEALVRHAKGKDKGVYRIARDKLDAIRQAQQAQAELVQQTQSLCQQMEQMARAVPDPLHAAKLEHLQQQWRQVAEQAPEADRERFQQALTQAQQHWQAHQQQQQIADAESARQLGARGDRQAACELLEQAMQQMMTSPATLLDDAPALNGLLKTQALRWQEAHENLPAQPDERRRFEQAYRELELAVGSAQRLRDTTPALVSAAEQALALTAEQGGDGLHKAQRRLQKLVDDIQWPERLPRPAVLDSAHRALQHLAQLGASARSAQQHLATELAALIAQLQDAIKAGRLKPAQKKLRDAQALLQQIPEKQAGDLARQLRDLQQQVFELRDWQGFATQPKKEALCDAMEALPEQGLDPEALAVRIKRLQDDWKGLGGSEGDKALWDRFHAAAERAYEPCKAHFAKLADVRAGNLAQRQRMVAQLDTYLSDYDWAHADWKAVGEVYHTAKQEWRQYAPVERKAGDQVQAEFNQRLDELKARLEGEYARNKQLREALISQAEALVDGEDLGQAINAVKQLQQQWKAVGVVARRDDQKLWKRFRAACDQVFASRDAQRETAQAERVNRLNEARSLLTRMNEVLADETLDIAAVKEAWQQHQQAFQALEPLPREHREELHQQFRSQEAQWHTLQQQVRAARQQARQERFWQCIDEIDACAAAPGSAVVPDGPSDLPAPLLEALRQRAERVAAMNSPETTLPEAKSELQDLCVQMEILAETDSPPEDQARRMALQLERLTAGLGQRGAAGVEPTEQVVQHIVSWLAVDGVAHAERAALTERFRQAVSQAGGF